MRNLDEIKKFIDGAENVIKDVNKETEQKKKEYVEKNINKIKEFETYMNEIAKLCENLGIAFRYENKNEIVIRSEYLRGTEVHYFIYNNEGSNINTENLLWTFVNRENSRKAIVNFIKEFNYEDFEKEFKKIVDLKVTEKAKKADEEYHKAENMLKEE